MSDNGSIANRIQQELIVQQLYKLALSQTEAIMQLCHALRSDPNVNDQTRKTAEQTWDVVTGMIDQARIIAKIYASIDSPEPSDE